MKDLRAGSRKRNEGVVSTKNKCNTLLRMGKTIILGLLVIALHDKKNRYTTTTAFTPASLSYRPQGMDTIRRNPNELTSPLQTTTAKTRRSQSSTSTSLNMVVFTRLSEDCLTALKVANEQALLLKQDEVDNNLMLLGITNAPGRTQSTLEKYQITWKNVKRVLNYLMVPAAGSNPNSMPKLSDFADKSKSADEMLPYSRSLQKTLNDAAIISQTMGSSEVNPEHVFLALLQFQEVTDGSNEPQAATRGDDCEAMEIIWHLDATLEGEDICQDLLQTLMQERTKEKERADKKAKKRAKKEERSGRSGTTTALGGGGNDEKQGEGDDDSEPKSVLAEFAVDLTQQARDGELDAIHGRDEEIQNCLRILVRRRKNNICLIGEAGVGKTSIAEGLAQIIASDEDCPMLLKGYRIMSLEVGSLLSGTKFRGEFEARLRAIVEELTAYRAPKTILFLDEIHTLVGAGATEGSMDAANLLKPYLARGQLQVVGATTITEYVKFISKDAALERRLQPVLIKEPSVEQTVGILQTLLPFYQQHHRVEFTPASLIAAAKLSDRYIPERFLPDKAIDLMDEAGALATLKRIPNEPPPEVTETLITDIISQWTGIPAGRLEMDEMERLQVLEASISQRVKGQNRAIKTVCKAIRRARTGIRNPKRPIASLLFCGPTGTGKTELCKTLAETYFGSERDLVRIDMSEYMEKYTVSRLTGPPPGYAGYEEGGQLTEAVRRAPHSVVLLDELEKAHGDVLNILLQVMEDGILTDGKGRTVSFKNTILIMTSNIGSQRVLKLAKKEKEKQIQSDSDIDSDSDSNNSKKKNNGQYSQLAGVVKSELEKVMKPEFLNRIDDIVVFEPLTDNELSLIASLMVDEIAIRAKYERGIEGIIVTPALLSKMVHEGSQTASQFGARPMRRAVQRVLEDAISDSVVQAFLVDGDRATFDVQENDDDDDSFYVMVSRERDEHVLQIEMEEAVRDVVFVDSEDDDDDDDEEEEQKDESDEPKDAVNGSSNTNKMEVLPHQVD